MKSIDILGINFLHKLKPIRNQIIIKVFFLFQLIDNSKPKPDKRGRVFAESDT